MRILTESIQDIERFLSRGIVKDLIDIFGKHLEDYGEDILYQVIDETEEQFGEDNHLLPKIEEVVICKVQGDVVDIVEPSHKVVSYNGYYYDYLAQEFSMSFTGLDIDSVPIIQKIIKDDNQISERLSSFKGYVMLGMK